MNKSDVFPSNNFEKVKRQNLQIQTYGQRLFRDQSQYEYLLEFLLVFISKKGTESDITEKGYSFPIHLAEGKISYELLPRLGLKRFIFLSRSEPEKRFKIDIEALEDHREYLKSKITINDKNLNKDLTLDILQDLLYGFNAIVGKRSWFAQSLLPIAPELIFCEAIGSKKQRENLHPYENGSKDVDYAFEFHQRSFMARGGEVYFLHVLQGLTDQDELKKELEGALKQLIIGVPQLSKVSQFVQGAWEEYHKSNEEKNHHFINKTIEWIPSNYKERSKYTVWEMKNLLKSLIDPLDKIDLLGTLIVLQIMRMMSLQASKKLGNDDDLVWVIDLTDEPNGQIRKVAASSYLKVEEDIYRAVHTADIKSYMDSFNKNGRNRTETEVYDDASKDTNRLIRKLGKDIEFVVPPKGKNMRFSLNENLVKLLVISLIIPGERMLLNTFLDKCYKHFKIVISPREAKLHWGDNADLDMSSFNDNTEKFQQILKDCGFLRDLSDATSIVENPFKE